jgi:hypothetical protein
MAGFERNKVSCWRIRAMKITAEEIKAMLDAGSADLPLRKLIGVGHEFRIGAGAQFIEVGALALLLRRNSLREEAIE